MLYPSVYIACTNNSVGLQILKVFSRENNVLIKLIKYLIIFEVQLAKNIASLFITTNNF
uniref:Uncharacterized protein n=1 Tax=Octopus bimaculoides TaxID=37653 RepID=A0A0L8IBA5_OCTBM